VLYQISSPAVAEWLRKEDIMAAFLEKLGGTSVYRNWLVNMVVEYVPTSFDPQLLGALEGVEKANRLLVGAIVSARFIKPHSCDQQASTHIYIFLNALSRAT
jgi:hypothetical protein